MEESDSNILFW